MAGDEREFLRQKQGDLRGMVQMVSRQAEGSDTAAYSV
jgi:hypothetical protein